MTDVPASSHTGRFAPSPTGPLHLGSLVAALGSWLFARARGGRWLVRMEDLDTPRVVPGAADDILRTLERFGLTWDGDVVAQSSRIALYDRAFEDLLRRREIYGCACSRTDLLRSASAPVRGEAGDAADGAALIYPGTCRSGLPPGRAARAFRFRVPPGLFTFKDLLFGPLSEDVSVAVGDFVVKRADGPYAYQLAVVVDDAAQGVTEVVRGADLLDSTARQIALQRALGLPTPSYAHLPLVVGPDGKKLGKRDGALALETLDEARVRAAFAFALSALGQEPAESPREAALRFDPSRIPREPRPAPG
ncbi:MAG: tRNA glutamyl-Q(34) synthetase GluQRS [Acidobacteria bacterium]|nr:tRNA glutamyl-Q(34) synthetase GluQRS [Acidobacteriota bacterium]